MLGSWNRGPWNLAGSANGANWPAEALTAQWIWSDKDAGSAATMAGMDRLISLVFSASFTADQPMDLQLYVVADESADVYVDGTYLGATESEAWKAKAMPRPFNFTVGPGTIAIHIQSVDRRGPDAGLLAALTFEGSPGQRTLLLKTDGDWLFSQLTRE